MRVLLGRGADANAVERADGETPLHAAAAHGHRAAAVALLDAGARVDAPSLAALWTPLHKAARNGELDVAKLLLRRGAPEAPRSVEGRSAEQTAHAFNQMETALFLREVRRAGGWAAYVRRSQNLSLKPPISLRSALFGLIL